MPAVRSIAARRARTSLAVATACALAACDSGTRDLFGGEPLAIRAPRGESGPPAPPLPPPPPAKLSFGAFSSAREAFGAKILPQFARGWRRAPGRDLDVAQRYAGSVTLEESIADGFAADVAVFATTEHLGRLAALGLVDPAWRAAPFDGIVSRSIVVLAVRPGNPKRIHDWTDL